MYPSWWHTIYRVRPALLIMIPRLIAPTNQQQKKRPLLGFLSWFCVGLSVSVTGDLVVLIALPCPTPSAVGLTDCARARTHSLGATSTATVRERRLALSLPCQKCSREHPARRPLFAAHWPQTLDIKRVEGAAPEGRTHADVRACGSQSAKSGTREQFSSVWASL